MIREELQIPISLLHAIFMSLEHLWIRMCERLRLLEPCELLIKVVIL